MTILQLEDDSTFHKHSFNNAVLNQEAFLSFIITKVQKMKQQLQKMKQQLIQEKH